MRSPRLILIAVLSVFASSVFAGGIAYAGTIQGDNDYQIHPDYRIGPVKLGMSDKDLFKLAVPNTTRQITLSGTKYIGYSYDDMSVLVYADTHKVAYVQVRKNTHYYAIPHIAIGSSMKDVEAQMGPPEKVKSNPWKGNVTYALDYWNKSIEFNFYASGTSMADMPEDTVQSIAIQNHGGDLF